MNTVPESIMDFHVHLFPDDIFEAIWSFFKRVYGFDVVHKLYARDCMEYLRNHGVGTIVYSHYSHRKGLAGVLNEWNIRLLDSSPDRVCFTACHPDDEDGMERARDSLDHPGSLG
ncbi:hypothetical protein EG833_03485, partial [archaeon]|nr:hypothetical protein [archaeon]